MGLLVTANVEWRPKNDNGMTINTGAGGGFGFRVPDVVANLRVDQAWGFAGISAALHDASGAYYLTPNNVNNGHPEDKYGWALAAGARFNLGSGLGADMIGFNVCYTEGAAGFCTNQGAFQLYNNSNNVGLAWIADGVFGSGTQIELTRVRRTSISGTRKGGPRGVAAMSTSTTTAPRPT